MDTTPITAAGRNAAVRARITLGILRLILRTRPSAVIADYDLDYDYWDDPPIAKLVNDAVNLGIAITGRETYTVGESNVCKHSNTVRLTAQGLADMPQVYRRERAAHNKMWAAHKAYLANPSSTTAHPLLPAHVALTSARIESDGYTNYIGLVTDQKEVQAYMETAAWVPDDDDGPEALIRDTAHHFGIQDVGPDHWITDMAKDVQRRNLENVEEEDQS
jgi:hypothetical protein